MTGTGTVTYIHWRDASQALEEFPLTDMEPIDLYEVGFLLKETEESVTISCEQAEDFGRLWLCIPKVNIVERRDMPLEKAFPPKRRRRHAPLV